MGKSKLEMFPLKRKKNSVCIKRKIFRALVVSTSIGVCFEAALCSWTAKHSVWVGGEAVLGDTQHNSISLVFSSLALICKGAQVQIRM